MAPERDQAGDFSVEMVGVQVGVAPVLGGLALGNGQEHQVDVPRVLGGGLHCHFAADVLEQPPEGRGPELAESLRVSGVERQCS